MSAPRTIEAIHDLLAPVVEAAGLELDCVTRATQSGMTLLRVTVDAPPGRAGVDSDTLAEVSRCVSKALDVADPIQEEYLLEVSTPGAERELTRPRHWLRQVGRLATVKLRDGSRVEGRVVAAGEDCVTMEVDGSSTTIEYVQVKKARARVEFTSVDEREE
ncbi:ribosome maturation factor RimP [Schaalia sp. 19OD2882]|uniref:ribosome maturation factor RimP n=1 Tax=Schaalia sp. 19OD2882 TaxID=2794089 RepID=UPI0020A77F39|nr:ribosome maturation factor RimP [Schaalia sp. 19OD2882]